MTSGPVLRASGLRVEVVSRAGRRALLDDVGFEVHAGRMTGIVGETGSGKSMTLRASMGLLPPGVQLTAGSVVIDDITLTGLARKQLRAVRGARMGFVPQQPLAALHPIVPLDRQFLDAMRAHEKISRRDAMERAGSMLEHVGILEPDRILASRVYELSGGLAQRTAIAMVLSLRPSVLLADEPTSALDVTIQREVLHLLRRLSAEDGLGILLVTHDLGVVAHSCHDVFVFKDGKVVEQGLTRDVLDRPRHEYTQRLVHRSTRTSDLGREPRTA